MVAPEVAEPPPPGSSAWPARRARRRAAMEAVVGRNRALAARVLELEATLEEMQAAGLASQQAVASLEASRVALAPALHAEVVCRLALAAPVVAEDVVAADAGREAVVEPVVRARRNVGLHNMEVAAADVVSMPLPALNKVQRAGHRPARWGPSRKANTDAGSGPRAPASMQAAWLTHGVQNLGLSGARAVAALRLGALLVAACCMGVGAW